MPAPYPRRSAADPGGSRPARCGRWREQGPGRLLPGADRRGHRRRDGPLADIRDDRRRAGRHDRPGPGRVPADLAGPAARPLPRPGDPRHAPADRRRHHRARAAQPARAFDLPARHERPPAQLRQPSPSPGRGQEDRRRRPQRLCRRPGFVDVPTEQLIAKDYAARRGSEIDPDRAKSYEPGAFPGFSPRPPGGGRTGASTHHVSVVDPAGNAVAVTCSNEQRYGSAVVVPGDGNPVEQPADGLRRAGHGQRGRRPGSGPARP